MAKRKNRIKARRSRIAGSDFSGERSFYTFEGEEKAGLRRRYSAAVVRRARKLYGPSGARKAVYEGTHPLGSTGAIRIGAEAMISTKKMGKIIRHSRGKRKPVKSVKRRSYRNSIESRRVKAFRANAAKNLRQARKDKGPLSDVVKSAIKTHRKNNPSKYRKTTSPRIKTSSLSKKGNKRSPWTPAKRSEAARKGWITRRKKGGGGRRKKRR